MRLLNFPRNLPARRSVVLGLPLFATFLIAGCARKIYLSAPNDAEKESWTGRISLQVQSDPPQAFFSGFELKGLPERGELSLVSPIGNVLAMLRWSPSEAVLESGNEIKRFASVDALLEQITGAAVPITALFDWLKGRNTRLDGWSADLSALDTGRISATRVEPGPLTQLRIVLDR